MNSWNTPSIAVRAVKPISPIKIGWIAPINWDAAQVRIRVLNVDRVLRSWGYCSSIVNYPEIINQNFDVAIIGKAFDENHFKNVRMLKQQHKKSVFTDICEDILDYPWVKEILEISDKVITCSYMLEDKVRKINQKVITIEDAWET